MPEHLTIDSPLGPILLAASEDGLVALYFEMRRHPPTMTDWVPMLAGSGAALVLGTAHRQLDEYFAGARTTFDVALAPQGTGFQRQVWNALRRIPYGETSTYGAMAAALGAPNASRAVGAANGRNPVSIIVPCHRLVGSNGALTGFGGGVERKRWLLDHERRFMTNR